MIFIYLPLIDDQGNDKGQLVRLRKRKPKNLPRIGETVYVLPKISLKVQDVNYSGLNWQYIAITLEPISVKYRAELERAPYLKGSDPWKLAQVRVEVDE